VDTFELLPSLAQGDLKETSVAELVSAVFRSRASGTLAIESSKTGEIRTFFRAGDMCGTASFTGFRNLAQVLLKNDWVDALQIESTQQVASQTGKRHGEVLVQQGVLTPDRLQQALGLQHQENLRVLLALTEGSYEWRGWEPPPAWAREVVVDPVWCVVEALAQQPLAPRRARVLQWLGSQVAKLSVDWPELQARVGFGPLERRAASMLALPRTAEEFVRVSGVTPALAEAVLVGLLLAGGAEVVEAGAPAPEEDLPELDLGELTPVEPLPDAAFDEPAPEPQKRVAPPADDDPLELDHGDPDQRASDLRKRMRARGLRNLGMFQKQEDQGAATEGAVVIDEPAPAPKIETGELDAESRALVEEVRDRAIAIEAQNSYARLGVAQNATQDQIKQAYLAAAKRYHPDRALSSPALASLLPELQSLFSALKEAHDSIATPEARVQYDTLLKQGSTGKVAQRREEASLALKMGDVLLKKRDFEGALAKLRRAADLDPNGDALAALAWCLVNDPKQPPAAKEEAASLINRALRAPGSTARTYYVAGVLWRTKDPASSADAFRKALELEPNHPDASLELRLLEMRQGKASKGGGVLSGLLFGKRKP
jgi:curved DNA-binding protein CbpA